MAESYKRLGAVAPTDDKYTLLYTSPAATEALVSNITVTNRSASAQTFDVQVYESGVTQQSNLEAGLPPTFVSVASSTTSAATSTDGITWTQRTLPTSADWSSVTYGNGVFVSMAQPAAASSTDGITWTQRTLPVLTRAYWKAIYGSNTFVAVASDSAGMSADYGATSTDGITWTQRTLPSANWRSVTYGGSTFVAVSGSGMGGFGVNIAASSTNGITWTQRTLPTNSIWRSVTYGNGTFVAVASYASSNTAASSTDGATWTLRTLPTNAGWIFVTYGNGAFIAVATSAAAASSTDGITWTQRTLPTSADWTSVTYGNGAFIAVAFGSTTAASSTDGITWTQRTLPTSANWRSVTYGEDIQPYYPPTQTTLYKTSDIAANSTEILEPGIALAPEGAVVVKDNSGGNLTFSTYGVELS